jgi:hypothetical protein
LTVGPTGLLFYAGQAAEGGDGVWRSSDGGDTWELLAAGLTDLRAQQEVVTADADHPYYVGFRLAGEPGALAADCGGKRVRGHWAPVGGARWHTLFARLG